MIINFVLTNTGATNENLLKLLDLCDQRGIEYESHFPVTMERPYAYQMDTAGLFPRVPARPGV